MPRRVSFCRLFIFLCLALLLLACSPAFLRQEKVVSQDFYYDWNPEAPFEEFRYEWVPTGDLSPWKLHYGLAYWRFKHGEETNHFVIPYFLIENKIREHYPSSFLLRNSRGLSWHFKRISTPKDHFLPFLSTQALEKGIKTLPDFLSPAKKTLDQPPFTGQVYILEPLVGQVPLDWATLRLLYEEGEKETFTFEWQEDPIRSIEGFSEPDRTLFPFHLNKEGIQTFMSTLKLWGIS